MTARELLFVCGVALAVTIGLMPMILWLLRRFQIADSPVARSSHSGVVPRGGGLAVLLGAASALVAAEALWATLPTNVVVIGLAALAFGGLGLADDLGGLGAFSRLIAQGCIALATAALVGPEFLGLPTAVTVPASALWMVVFVNAFNFMDGINGISAVTAAVIGGSVAVGASTGDPAIAALGLAIAGASAGFLPFNYPQARVFLGDVGSYGIGAALAGSAIISLDAGRSIIVVLAPFSLYVADVGTTLWKRARRGANLFDGHREHTYQRLANGGLGHGLTTAFIGALTALLALGGSVLGGSLRGEISLFAIGSGLLGLYLIAAPLYESRNRGDEPPLPRKVEL